MRRLFEPFGPPFVLKLLQLYIYSAVADDFYFIFNNFPSSASFAGFVPWYWNG